MERALKIGRAFTVTTALRAVIAFLTLPLHLRAQDSGEPIDLSRYANRSVLPDFTAGA
jgi:hypothetical protein